MKIVVAPNAFKNGMSAVQAADAISEGIRRVVPDADIARVPVADGGDGLHDVFRANFPGEEERVRVAGPLFAPVDAEYFFMREEKTAVVEMARASGLALLRPEQYNARAATTLGTGELALAAIRRGATKILVGIGGSATNDGGIGFARALGIKFLDAAGREVRPVGEELARIAAIDASRPLFEPGSVAWEAVCDVDNPLTGDRGATAVFGPQKGATPEDVALLDAGLANLAKRTEELLGRDFSAMPGAGAAGGLGFALAAFFNAALRPGVEVVLDMVGIDERLKGADLAFTAEGRMDYQTAYGKGPAGVASRAKKYGVPCFGLAGSVAGDVSNLRAIGMDACFSASPGPMTLDEAVRDGHPLLANIAEQSLRAFMAGRGRP